MLAFTDRRDGRVHFAAFLVPRNQLRALTGSALERKDLAIGKGEPF